MTKCISCGLDHLPSVSCVEALAEFAARLKAEAQATTTVDLSQYQAGEVSAFGVGQMLRRNGKDVYACKSTHSWFQKACEAGWFDEDAKARATNAAKSNDLAEREKP